MARINRVIVLGCGPAGLFAAHAATQAGRAVRIYSKARPSRMFGAQYLHAEIPGLTENQDAFDLEYTLRGTVDGYRSKVYGPGSTAVTSPERLLGFHRAWDIREAYDRAWKLYHDRVDHTELTTAGIHTLATEASRRTLVVSTVPAPLLCGNPGHAHVSAEIWAMGDAPELQQYAPVTVTADTVVCNGEDSPAWYRAANILGWRSVEWPGSRKPPVDGVALVEKPVRTDCTCLPSVLRAGRYGTWTKGILSHHAYEETLKALS